jgi:glycosyltransferase involved in cell wall biosynthesis
MSVPVPYKVLYAVGSLEAGGLERFVTRASIRARNGQELNPVVICLRARTGRFVGDLESAGVPVIEAPRGWERQPIALSQLSRLVKSTQPDIVHSQVNFAMIQQTLAFKGGGAKAVCITERNCYPLQGLALGRRRLQFWLLKKAGVTYSANSAAVAAYFSKMVRVPEAAIPVLPNCAPIIKPNDRTRKAVRLQLGVADDVLLVGYVGRMAAHKGQELFLRSMKELQSNGITFHACFVGDGPNCEFIKNLVERLELEEWVVFTGVVDNVEDYLRSFDALVLLSSHEGMPNVILEAMAAGLPVMATNVGAASELLDEGAAGILVSGKQQEEITRELGRLCHGVDLRKEMGEKARIRATTNYSLEKTYALLLRHYVEAVGA